MFDSSSGGCFKNVTPPRHGSSLLKRCPAIFSHKRSLVVTLDDELMATQFSTPRGAARRIGPPPSLKSLPLETDHRFSSPRGAATSSRAFSSDNSMDDDLSTPRDEPASYSSDEQDEPGPPILARPRSYYKDIAFAKPVKADVFSLARHNRVDDVRDMLDSGLPVNIQDAYGNSLLLIACQNGLKRLAKELLRRGANINAQNTRGNTPLHFCYAYGYGETLGAYLISKGADVTIRNGQDLECYYGIEAPPSRE
ncbi:Aste57867_8880 [Aphanomyces stellatus]|uniref:Aste57867_8880 protein n=1 Tax=Aphanomyces stellatus TaxID=120398 RepID=A0A485KLK5_9STRA|nr:hypothetical protein As57867_008845 [Aphanomyces stellatus]VFT85766.1 Aste57867_8880 [Aphanomyces stellatus]